MNNVLYRSIFIYLYITIDPSTIHLFIVPSINRCVSFPPKTCSPFYISHSRCLPRSLSLSLALSHSQSLSLSLSLLTCLSLPPFPLWGKELALVIASRWALQIASAWPVRVMCATDVWAAAWLLFYVDMHSQCMSGCAHT